MSLERKLRWKNLEVFVRSASAWKFYVSDWSVLDVRMALIFVSQQNVTVFKWPRPNAWICCSPEVTCCCTFIKNGKGWTHLRGWKKSTTFTSYDKFSSLNRRILPEVALKHVTHWKWTSSQAPSYASEFETMTHWLTYLLTGVKCRATSVAKKERTHLYGETNLKTFSSRSYLK